MALIKNVQTPYGIAATYWRIYRVEYTHTANQDIMQVVGYIDETARRQNAQPIMVLTYQGDFAEKTRADLYPNLKLSQMQEDPGGDYETNLLINAEDC